MRTILYVGYVHALDLAACCLGNFAVWGLCFSCFDCSIAFVRRREDAWNAIGAGAATGGLLAARGTYTSLHTSHLSFHFYPSSAGPKAIARNAIVGGVLLGLIEGFSTFLYKLQAQQIQRESQIPVWNYYVRHLTLLFGCRGPSNGWNGPVGAPSPSSQAGGRSFLILSPILIC